MNIWHDISPERIQPEEFIACIEISKGGKNKYELDKETGMLMLDRVLYTSTHFPLRRIKLLHPLANNTKPVHHGQIFQPQV